MPLATTAPSDITIDGRPLDDHIRRVTDDEVETYHRDGWAKLPGLFSAELTAALAEEAERCARDAGAEQALEAAGAWAVACLAQSGRTPLYSAVLLSRGMGSAAFRLINRPRLTDEIIPIRYFADGIGIRAGEGRGPSTHFHQDYHPQSQDRPGAINFWIAPYNVGPDQGGMNFLTGSHREGRLGELYENGMPDSKAPDQRRPMPTDLRYPKLGELYEMTPGLVYGPGDATVHDCHAIHCAPANMSSEPRWNFIVSYMPDDVRYQKLKRENLVLDKLSLEPGQSFDHENFPIVHPGVEEPALAGAR